MPPWRRWEQNRAVPTHAHLAVARVKGVHLEERERVEESRVSMGRRNGADREQRSTHRNHDARPARRVRRLERALEGKVPHRQRVLAAAFNRSLR